MSQERDDLQEMLQRLPEHKLGRLREFMEYIKREDDEDVADIDDEMDPEEQAALDASLKRSIAQADAGLGRPAEEFFAELKRTR